MHRILRWTLRALAAAAIIAAIADFALPGGSRPRLRVHVIDWSPSTNAGFTQKDALRLALHDLETHEGKIVLFADRAGVFSGTLDTAPPVGPPVTDIGKAIETALAMDADDIILHSDARSTRGDLEAALVRAEAKGVPVHVVPIGPADPDDVRIVSIDAPARAASNETYAVTVTLFSTRDREVVLELDSESRAVRLNRRVPRSVTFDRRGPGSMNIRVRGEDEFPRNQQARIVVRDDAVGNPVLVLTSTPGSVLSKMADVSTQYVPPFDYSVVVLEDLPAGSLTQDQMEELRRYVTEFGGGLFMLGGPASLGPGGYAGTPIEDVLPIHAWPDDNASILFLLDRSGSMSAPLPGSGLRKYDAAVLALEQVVGGLPETIESRIVVFNHEAQETELSALRMLDPNGSTLLMPALEKARSSLDKFTTSKRLVVMITDGETTEDWEKLKASVASLGARYVAVATGKEPHTTRLRSLGKTVPLDDFNQLREVLEEVIGESREWIVTPEGLQPLDDFFRGLSSWPRPARLNRTTRKKDARLLLKAGEYPALAVRTAGRGRTAGATFGFSRGWPGGLDGWDSLSTLLSGILDWLSGPGAEGRVLTLRRDGTRVRIRCTHSGKSPESFAWVGPNSSGTLTAKPTGSREVGAEFEFDEGGTLHVRAGGVIASLHLPHPMEFAEPGIDAASLERMARRTGGRTVGSAPELAALPGDTAAPPVSGRPWFIAAALILFLLDLAIGSFWKP